MSGMAVITLGKDGLRVRPLKEPPTEVRITDYDLGFPCEPAFGKRYVLRMGDGTEQVMHGDCFKVIPEARMTETTADALNRIADKCAHDGWDGRGSRGIGADAVARTKALLKTLPADMPPPGLAPEEVAALLEAVLG